MIKKFVTHPLFSLHHLPREALQSQVPVAIR